MSPSQPLSEYRFARGDLQGSQFTLYPGRLVHDGGSAVEHMPLAHIAAVRIEFAREGGKLKWAAIFLVLAILLAMAASPLQGLASTAYSEVAEHAKREGTSGGGVGAALQLSFRALERFAASLPVVGFAIGAWAAVLLAIFAWGRTTLTLVLGATEREYSVRGRDHSLLAFAESLSDRLAQLSG
jgi:hypothetical protein